MASNTPPNAASALAILENESGVAASASRKRPRATRAGSTYARKRAVAACELCRSRKAKCDNQRPCSTCVSFGANCVFKDRESDHSTFDPASLAILERVNYAVRLLEQSAISRTASTDETSPVVGSFDGLAGLQDNGELHTPHSNIATGASVTHRLDETVADKLSVNTRCACTHILDWPIFKGRIKPSSVNPALYDETADSFAPQLKTAQRSPIAARIDEGDVHELVQAFLRNVHIKNPILERHELLRQARLIGEEGFKWDAPSCLILVACALGSISAAWEVAVPKYDECSLDDTRSHALADAYYTAARKRVGLLETSNQATQCWFLLGVFEMYKMMPLNGWASFSRACTLLELRLYTQTQHGHQGFTRGERRLYWSCLKSEAELREEFDLPEPGLARIEHPYVLPSPPERTQDPGNDADVSSLAWDTVHEQSWYYYLSDIAYRRITNRTIAALYSMPMEQWLQHSASRLYAIAQELEAQVLQWWETIPGSPMPGCNSDTDELTYMLYLNYVDLRERIWRPFLYILIHQDRPDPSFEVYSGAQTCLEMSLGMLKNALLKHRHHGCWQTIRCMFSKALVIIAAAKSNRTTLAGDWRQRIESFQQYMQYWEAEAPDIGAAKRTLSTLLAGEDET